MSDSTQLLATSQNDDLPSAVQAAVLPTDAPPRSAADAGASEPNGVEAATAKPDAPVDWSRAAGFPTESAPSRLKPAAAYLRVSTDMQDSEEDQLATCRADARAKGYDIPDAFVFCDHAISGQQSRRPGLTKLYNCIAAKQVSALFVYTTSRLSRLAHRARATIEERLQPHGVRFVAVRSGVDTEEANWKVMLAVHGIADETVIDNTRKAVRDGHLNYAQQGLLVGGLPEGYTAVGTGQRKASGKEKKKVKCDPARAEIVRLIYDWYVNSDMTVRQVVQRLNELGHPRRTRADRSRSTWSEPVVTRILKNPKYRGFWEWGKTTSIRLPTKDYIAKHKLPKPLYSEQIEELRIVDDATWYAAQKKLASRHRGGGRRAGSMGVAPGLLNGILVCSAHGKPLGCDANHYFCVECRRSGKPTLFSVASRELATRSVLSGIAEAIRTHPTLPSMIAERFVQEAGRQMATPPEATADLERRIGKLDRSIRLLEEEPGESEEDLASSRQALRSKRAERAGLRAELAKLREASARPAKSPSSDEIRAALDGLGDEFCTAASSLDGRQRVRLRRLLEATLVDGVISVEQRGEHKVKRGWLAGRAKLNLCPAIANAIDTREPGGCDQPIEVVFEFRPVPIAEQLADRAGAMWDKGIPVMKIRETLIAERRVAGLAQPGLGRTTVTAALRAYCAKLGREYDDGRTRSFTIAGGRPPPLYQRIADRVAELESQGRYLQDIAQELDVSKPTIENARRWLAQRAGLQFLDGRTRRYQVDGSASASASASPPTDVPVRSTSDAA